MATPAGARGAALRYAAGLLALAGAACSPRPRNFVYVSSSLAQTVSLLGDTLYPLPLDAAGGPARVQRLLAAREELGRDSADLRAWLRLGRATVGMGRLREAVGLFSRAAEPFSKDPRVYRERGEVWLRLRRFGPAMEDFRRALAVFRGAQDRRRPRLGSRARPAARTAGSPYIGTASPSSSSFSRSGGRTPSCGSSARAAGPTGPACLTLQPRPISAGCAV